MTATRWKIVALLPVVLLFAALERWDSALALLAVLGYFWRETTRSARQ